jgi:hypothetical protein
VNPDYDPMRFDFRKMMEANAAETLRKMNAEPLADWERELLDASLIGAGSKPSIVWIDEPGGEHAVSETDDSDLRHVSFEQAVQRILNEVIGANIESDEAVREEARKVLTRITNEITAIVRRLDDGG